MSVLITEECLLFFNSLQARQSLVAATAGALRLLNKAKFAQITDAFRFHDKDHNGLLDKEELRAVCFEYNIPVNGELIDKLFESASPEKNGKIDFETFSKYFDWRSQDAQSLL